jgi:hypothetical protein
VSDNYRKVRAAADRLMNMKRDLDIQVCGHYYFYTLNKQKHHYGNITEVPPQTVCNEIFLNILFTCMSLVLNTDWSISKNMYKNCTKK